MATTSTTHNSFELGQIRLTLRDDLQFTLQEYGGVICYVIEDKVNSRFYRIGTSEYTLLSQLDGQTTLRDAIGQSAEVLGNNAFTDADVAGICKWLIDCQLATTDAVLDIDRLLDVGERTQRRAARRWLNPLLVKLPLGNPKSLLRTVTPWLGWIASRPAMIVWTILCGIAAYRVFGQWHEFSINANGVMARDNWIWLGLTWLCLKILHEFSHALACRRFGGCVREAGFVLILFAPIPYVDVTSAWKFPSKWQRIAVSAAGMYAELFVAAIAAIAWTMSDDQLVRHHACNVVFMASVVTLLFNLNFLMRFDGYYMLSDVLEIPNLYSLGQQYVHYLGRRYALGVPASLPRWPLHKATIVKLYGVASFFWRLFVCVCLILAAEALFYGAGVLLAVLAIALWFGVPAVKFARYLVFGNGKERPSIIRFAVATSLSAAIVTLALVVLPWPGGIDAPAVVRYSEPMYVRAETPGFVRRLCVRPGDHVELGQTLVVLENRELELDLQNLQLIIQQSLLRSRSHHRQGNVSAYQAENTFRQANQERALQLQHQIDRLVIQAPINGQVVANDLDSLRGQFVATGTQLLVIADESKKELFISIAQDDLQSFESKVGMNVDAAMNDTETGFVSCHLTRVVPRATTEITEPALAAAADGPLPIRIDSDMESSSVEGWQLVEPRFTATAQISTAASRRLKSGQRGWVRLDISRGTVGSYVCKGMRDWLRSRRDGI